MSKLKLAKQGVFWTVQGEGSFVGEPMIFIRLAGCSVGCPGCDTDYKFSEAVAVEDIIDQCYRIRNETGRAEYVWVTGGEPLDQNLRDLNKALWSAEFKPCVATSGVHETDSNWWCLSVSPHTVDFKVRAGYEIKLVPGLNGLDINAVDLSTISFGNKFVQTLEGGEKSLSDCLEFLKRNRHWRMSPQCHKQWRLP